MRCRKCGCAFEKGRYCPECGFEEISKTQIYNMKINHARRYGKEIKRSSFLFHIAGEIPRKKLNNAIASFAHDIDENKIICFYDLTPFDSGKEAIIFTDDAIYFKHVLLNSGAIFFKDIEYTDTPCHNYSIYFHLKDKRKIEWTEKACDANCGPLSEFINKLLKVDRKFGTLSSKKLSKFDIMKKYSAQLGPYSFHLGGDIPSKKLANALSTYAKRAQKEGLLGLWDTTVFDTGKKGIVFTDKTMYQNIEKNFPNELLYEDIANVIMREGKLTVEKTDGKCYSGWFHYSTNEPLVALLNEIRMHS